MKNSRPFCERAGFVFHIQLWGHGHASLSVYSELFQDLALVKTLPLADWEWLAESETWRVRRPERYTHIPALKWALTDRQAQLSMF